MRCAAVGVDLCDAGDGVWMGKSLVASGMKGAAITRYPAGRSDIGGLLVDVVINEDGVDTSLLCWIC